MRSILCAVIFFYSVLHLNAQNDTAFYNASLANTIQFYESSLKGQQLYYNGSAYTELELTDDEEFPYFMTSEWQTGSIDFSGHHFNNIPLLYDITTDQVLSEIFNDNIIALNPAKLSGFKMGNQNFVKIENRTINNSLPNSGYYEILYNGNTKVIALHQKQRQERIEGKELHIYFDQKHRYFVFKKDRFYAVNNKRSILKVFDEQRNSLKSLISKNHIRFRHNNARALARVAELYNTLIPQ
jgi:hypothetical protein